jgi:hypothetical protein
MDYNDPRDIKAEAVRRFMANMANTESSSGQNINHPVQTSGIHAGTHAVGNYGIMPVTAQEIAHNAGVNQLQGMDKFEAQDQLMQDPELQYRLASTMASKLLNKNDSETAAYKYHGGQNSHPTQDDLDDSDEVDKFKAFRVLQNAK